jgi:predicted DNA-binding transcriptional regulator YafY
VLAEETEDGWQRMEVTFQDSRHAEWAVWRLSVGAEVLEPQWLRAALRERAMAVAARYGDGAGEQR